MLSYEIKKCIEKSVLCWLATSNKQNEPNVSPKEIFTHRDNKTLLIANIASLNSVNNILENPNVCVSFVDIFAQKGFKLNGTAVLINCTDSNYTEKVRPLTDLFTNEFSIKTVIEITVNTVNTIKAPSYYLYPDRTEQMQIENAMRSYKVKPVD